MLRIEWKCFRDGDWAEHVDVRDFIQKNYAPYFGESSFLEGISKKTKKLWKKCESLKAYGYEVNANTEDIFTKYRKTHNQGVFDAYTKETKLARKTGLLTGLPDAYGRGRIIGDYRRVPLYGIDFLIQKKQQDFDNREVAFLEENFRLREEISE